MDRIRDGNVREGQNKMNDWEVPQNIHIIGWYISCQTQE